MKLQLEKVNNGYIITETDDSSGHPAKIEITVENSRYSCWLVVDKWFEKVEPVDKDEIPF